MPSYKVLINDNAHYMDESERADHGVFANADEAVAACKEIVDDDLNAMWKPGTTARELYQLYVAFGPIPSSCRSTRTILALDSWLGRMPRDDARSSLEASITSGCFTSVRINAIERRHRRRAIRPA